MTRRTRPLDGLIEGCWVPPSTKLWANLELRDLENELASVTLTPSERNQAEDNIKWLSALTVGKVPFDWCCCHCPPRNRRPDNERPRYQTPQMGYIGDLLAMGTPVKGLETELEAFYNNLCNPKRNGTKAAQGRPYTPQVEGYTDEEALWVLIDQAVGTYLLNWHSFEREAPKTAAAIRKTANANPEIRELLQLDSEEPHFFSFLRDDRRETEPGTRLVRDDQTA